MTPSMQISCRFFGIPRNVLSAIFQAKILDQNKRAVYLEGAGVRYLVVAIGQVPSILEIGSTWRIRGKVREDCWPLGPESNPIGIPINSRGSHFVFQTRGVSATACDLCFHGSICKRIARKARPYAMKIPDRASICHQNKAACQTAQ